MSVRFLLGLLLLSNIILAQKKVCLFSNKSELNNAKELLIEKAKLFDINIIETKNTDSLSSFQAVFFLDFDEKKLSIKDNAALVAFFKNGGGAIGAFDIQAGETKRIWFEQMFGKDNNSTAKSKDLDLIPLKDLSNMGLSPLWKVTSADILNLAPPKYLKPVLMDLGGNAVSWSGTSEFGNQVYYTAIKLDSNTIQNPDFFKSIIGGTLSVLSTKNSVIGEIVKLPAVADFRVVNLAKQFQNATCLEYFSNEYCLLLTSEGNLYNYHSLSKELISLGKFDSLSRAVDITADPEFINNGYFYFYFSGEKENVKRIKMLSPIKAEIDDFLTESSLPTKNTFFCKSDSIIIGMPKYYQGKRIGLDSDSEIEISTLNTEGEVIDMEPFVLSFGKDSIKAIAQKENGEMLILLANKLQVIQHKMNEVFPPNANFTFKNLTSKPPYKVELEALTENGFEVEWNILGKKLVGRKVIQLFKTVGDFQIKMKVFDSKGLSDSIVKTIKIEKASIK